MVVIWIGGPLEWIRLFETLAIDDLLSDIIAVNKENHTKKPIKRLKSKGKKHRRWSNNELWR